MWFVYCVSFFLIWLFLRHITEISMYIYDLFKTIFNIQFIPPFIRSRSPSLFLSCYLTYICIFVYITRQKDSTTFRLFNKSTKLVCLITIHTKLHFVLSQLFALISMWFFCFCFYLSLHESRTHSLSLYLCTLNVAISRSFFYLFFPYRCPWWTKIFIFLSSCVYQIQF